MRRSARISASAVRPLCASALFQPALCETVIESSAFAHFTMTDNVALIKKKIVTCDLDMTDATLCTDSSPDFLFVSCKDE